MNIKSFLQRGTKDSATRLNSYLIVITGVISFILVIITLIILMFINKFDKIEGTTIGIILTSIIAYIGTGITGKYLGHKLEVTDDLNKYTEDNISDSSSTTSTSSITTVSTQNEIGKLEDSIQTIGFKPINK